MGWLKPHLTYPRWPKHWLPDEVDMSSARILTYGYQAHFSSKKEQTTLTTNDFANDLLFRMKYDEETEEKLGQVPIIFVTHSMGGLVFKKACELHVIDHTWTTTDFPCQISTAH